MSYFDNLKMSMYNKDNNLPRTTTRRSCKELEELFFDAIIHSNPTTVKECLKKGVDPNILYLGEEAALHIAAERGDTSVGQILINDKTVDLNKVNVYGETALYLSCRYGKRKFVQLLLQNSADPNISNITGRTPLHMATYHNQTEIIRDLIESDAEINVIDNFGNTPLSFSVIETANITSVEYLLSKGANISLNSQKSINLLMELTVNTRDESQIRIAELLLKYGANVNECNISGRNCLHVVGATNYAPLARFLLLNGAKLKMLDRSGRNPIHVAKEYKSFDVLKVFYEWMMHKNLVGTCSNNNCVRIRQCL